jgi:hypothetical protein
MDCRANGVTPEHQGVDMREYHLMMLLRINDEVNDRKSDISRDFSHEMFMEINDALNSLSVTFSEFLECEQRSTNSLISC